VGPLGRRVEDVALALNALTAGGRDRLDATSRNCEQDYLAHLEDSIQGRAVGVIPALLEAEGLAPEVRAAIEAAAAKLADAGARIVEVELPNMANAIAAYYVLAPCEAFSNLARFDGVRYGYQEPGCATLAEQSSLSRAHGFGPEAKRRQMLGAYLLSSGVYERYYLAAQKVRTLITADYQRAFAQVDAIAEYNKGVEELQKIQYTDYVGIMMSSITSIINAITYVLIAFVAISLIVSSIMIGVITLISVQERTKEIGILRAIGASKKDVSGMFNAETVIIGLVSGMIGVGVTYLL
jgi:hypothetical protein